MNSIKVLCSRLCRSPVIVLFGITAFFSTSASADQGGVSFWVPGLFGSLAAAPQQPGAGFAMIYYHTSVEASGAVAAAKEVEIGRLRANASADLNVNLDGRANLGFFVPSYVFETPIFGGQFAVSMATIVGRNSASLDGTLSASLGPLTVTRQGTIADSITGFADLFPQANLRWNSGVHNLMVYAMTNVQVGAYDSRRLANLGLGHGAIDGGVGYTYLDPTKGHEFSIVGGLTHNFRNKHTGQTNGLDLHVDLAAAQFLSKQFFVGAVGYVYQQLMPDTGQPAFLGSFESRVFGVGPQIGYLFPAGNMQGYLNLKGYYEFEAQNRPEGWNVWLTLALTPPEKSRAPSAMVARGPALK